ncbi:MAG: hypothetical protein J3R72DRAFT_447471 [Linnemannia gamsii]|nr:MAG: hypothetical protein J3R72DRAFT_447471 [Linnemannia gamsii]
MESNIEDIIMEGMIMDRTANYSVLIRLLFIIPHTVIIFYFVYWLCLLSQLLCGIFRHPECLYKRIGSLYAARDEANKCLSLLHQDILQEPIKIRYSCTYGSCTRHSHVCTDGACESSSCRKLYRFFFWQNMSPRHTSLEPHALDQERERPRQDLCQPGLHKQLERNSTLDSKATN